MRVLCVFCHCLIMLCVRVWSCVCVFSLFTFVVLIDTVRNVKGVCVCVKKSCFPPNSNFGSGYLRCSVSLSNKMFQTLGKNCEQMENHKKCEWSFKRIFSLRLEEGKNWNLFLFVSFHAGIERTPLNAASVKTKSLNQRRRRSWKKAKSINK